jgi:hypothetical protein
MARNGSTDPTRGHTRASTNLTPGRFTMALPGDAGEARMGQGRTDPCWRSHSGMIVRPCSCLHDSSINPIYRAPRLLRCGAVRERAAPPRGVGQGRWAPGAVGVVQVGPGRHDLVDPVENCVVEGERGALQ